MLTKEAAARPPPTPTTEFLFLLQTVKLVFWFYHKPRPLSHFEEKSVSKLGLRCEFVEKQENNFFFVVFFRPQESVPIINNQSISSINQLVICCLLLLGLKTPSQLFLHPSTDCHETARLRRGHKTMFARSEMKVQY